MKVHELVSQFGQNDKSPVIVYDYAVERVIFENRIDYIQHPYNEEQEKIREAEIDHLDVNGGKFYIYIDTTKREGNE